MKLLIDDFRTLSEADRVVRNYEDGISALKERAWDVVYLDHDIGSCGDCEARGVNVGDMKTPETTFYNSCPHAKTGYDILCWLEENPKYIPKNIILVTANPVGRKRMEVVLTRLYGK